MADRVWITRAQPDADRTARRLADLGYEAVVAPVLTIQSLAFEPPAPATIAALAFTSANGVAAFAGFASAFRNHPVFTVGAATAEAARTAGFTQVQSADGDAQALARLLAEAAATGPVLAPGAAQPAADLQALTGPGVRILPLAVYEAVETGVAVPAFDAVLIHSPRAARAVAALGLAAAGRFPWSGVLGYIVAQVIGGVVATSALVLIGLFGPDGWLGAKQDAGFASNGYGPASPGGFGLGAAIVVEVLFTAIFVTVILGVTHRTRGNAGLAGLVIGLTLTLIHLATIPIDNTSVNPARSIATAIYGGGEALAQLWVFIVFPLLGGVIAGLVYRALFDGQRKA